MKAFSISEIDLVGPQSIKHETSSSVLAAVVIGHISSVADPFRSLCNGKKHPHGDCPCPSRLPSIDAQGLASARSMTAASPFTL
eukprot:6290477-Amphidinium_carterae.3